MRSRVNEKYAKSVMLKNFLRPLEIYPGAGKKWKVKCIKCGTVGFPTFAHVQSRGGGCKTCGNKRTAESKKLNPKVAALFIQKNGYEPQEEFKGTKVPWLCIHLECGKLVKLKYERILSGQGGCKECGIKKSALSRKLKEQDVLDEVIKLEYRPIEIYQGTKKRWKFLCNLCNSVFDTNLESIRKGAKPFCLKCKRREAGILRRTPISITTYEFNKVGLNLVEDFPGIKKPWRCKCQVCGKITAINIESVRKRIAKNNKLPVQGCEECVFKAQGKHRMLSQEEVNKRLKSLDMKPLGIYSGALNTIQAVCLICGTYNLVTLGKAFSTKRACKKCSLKRRSDLARKPEADAVEEMLKFGFKPLEPYKNVNSPWLSLHLICNKQVSPRLASVRKLSGCSFCAKYGFDSASPAFLYLLVNSSLKAIKVGITGTKTTRLKSLINRKGWKLVHKYSFETGAEAKLVEQIVLNWWREELLAEIALTPKDSGLLGGWSETTYLDLVSPEMTMSFIQGILSKN
jgi:hypothetical protein